MWRAREVVYNILNSLVLGMAIEMPPIAYHEPRGRSSGPPDCYGARSSISMLGVPTVGTHSWKRIQRETVTLVGPMTLQESLQIRNNRLSIPVTVSGIHSHLKTSKYMTMYN